jgi:hypothetical protein
MSGDPDSLARARTCSGTRRASAESLGRQHRDLILQIRQGPLHQRHLSPKPLLSLHSNTTNSMMKLSIIVMRSGCCCPRRRRGM